MKIRLHYLKTKNDIVEVVGQIPAQKGDLLLMDEVRINDKDQPMNVCIAFPIIHYLYVRFDKYDRDHLVAVYTGEFGCLDYAPAEPSDEEVDSHYSFAVANYENYKYTAILSEEEVMTFTEWVKHIKVYHQVPTPIIEF